MRQGMGSPSRGAVRHVANAHVHDAALDRAADSVMSDPPDRVALDQMCTAIARYFINLRSVLRVSPTQIAAYLVIDTAVIEALENGFVDHLPAWPETTRIVTSYTALAGIDGRAVLVAIGDAIQLSADLREFDAAQAQPRLEASFKRTGVAIANRASSLRSRAQAGGHPKWLMMAVVVTVAMVMAGLNTSAVGQALRPVHRVASDVGDFFRVHFAPVREGHRWIEVRDPRSRRGDKLRIQGG